MRVGTILCIFILIGVCRLDAENLVIKLSVINRGQTKETLRLPAPAAAFWTPTHPANREEQSHSSQAAQSNPGVGVP